MAQVCAKPCSDEARIFCDNVVNTMVADALAPCVARASATLILTMQDEWDLCLQLQRISTPSGVWV